MIHKVKQGGKVGSVEIRTGEAMLKVEKRGQKEIKSHIKKDRQPKELLYLIKTKKGSEEKGTLSVGKLL